MIVFLGDSFTWGQGLYFEDWIQKGKTSVDINKCEGIYHETLSYDDHLYRKKKHFPNLVAKHFNKHYDSPIITNGGSNWQILQQYNDLPTDPNLIKLVVIQFTCPLRFNSVEPFFKKMIPDISNYNLSQDYVNMVDFTNKKSKFLEGINRKKLSKLQIELFADYLGRTSVKTLALSWFPEIGKELKDNLRENFIPILYEGNEFMGFEEIMYNNNIILSETVGCFDQHFNSIGNEIIAKSIIKKVEELKIF